MKRKILSTVAAMGFAALLVSCGEVPQSEIDLTKATVDSAKVAGSSTYIPEDFAQLEDSLAAVLERIEIENGKTFKNFDNLTAELASVKQYAYQVIERTEARKVEMQQEIQNVLAEVKTLIEENKVLIAQAPKGKEGKEALEQISAELTAIETSVGETDNLLAQSDYIGALDKSKLAKENATSINTELKEVMVKAGKKVVLSR